MKRINRAGRITLIFMAIYCIAALVSSAWSREFQTISGNDLYNFCTRKAPNPTAVISSMFCLGYLTAVLDAPGTGTTGKRACVPPNVDENQIVDMATGYIRAHPETRHLTAFGLAAQALSANFPCR